MGKVALGVVLLAVAGGSTTAWAEGPAEESCSLVGYFKIPCGTGFRIERKKFPDGIMEINWALPGGGGIIIQALPFSSFKDRRGSLKAVIDSYRQVFSTKSGITPQESWEVQYGTKVYQLRYPPSTAVWMTSTRSGYVMVTATWTDPDGPVLKQADQVRLEGRPITETIVPPAPARTSARWVCSATGYYRTCQGSSYERRCSTQSATGMGNGSTKQMASSAAIASCIRHRLSMKLIHINTHHVEDGAPCQVTRCQGG